MHATSSTLMKKENSSRFLSVVDMNVYKELYLRVGSSVLEIFLTIIYIYKPDSCLNTFVWLSNDRSHYYCQVVGAGGKCCIYKL